MAQRRGQIQSRRIVLSQRRDLGCSGFRQSCLRANDFQIVCHTRAKTITRHLQFPLRQLEQFVRCPHPFCCCMQSRKSQAHIFFDLPARAVQFEFTLPFLTCRHSYTPPRQATVEDGHVQLHSRVPRRQICFSGSDTADAVVAKELDIRQQLSARGPSLIANQSYLRRRDAHLGTILLRLGNG